MVEEYYYKKTDNGSQLGANIRLFPLVWTPWEIPKNFDLTIENRHRKSQWRFQVNEYSHDISGTQMVPPWSNKIKPFFIEKVWVLQIRDNISVRLSDIAMVLFLIEGKGRTGFVNGANRKQCTKFKEELVIKLLLQTFRIEERILI